MRKSTIYLFVLGVAVLVMASVASAGLVVSAQNTNSSATMANTNTSKPKGKTRRHKRRAKPAATTDDTTATADTTAAAPAMPMKRHTGRCDPSQQEQTDLSGTYTGKARHGNEAPVDATLTITGNNFTMTSGSDNHAGRITAVTTCGYTAVTMMMGDLTPPAPSPNPPAAFPAMSLRAKKVGDSLTLTSVPGERMKVWFSTSGGGGMRHKPRKHRRMKPAAPGAAAPATTPMPKQ